MDLDSRNPVVRAGDGDPVVRDTWQSPVKLPALDPEHIWRYVLHLLQHCRISDVAVTLPCFQSEKIWHDAGPPFKGVQKLRCRDAEISAVRQKLRDATGITAMAGRSWAVSTEHKRMQLTMAAAAANCLSRVPS